VQGKYPAQAGRRPRPSPRGTAGACVLCLNELAKRGHAVDCAIKMSSHKPTPDDPPLALTPDLTAQVRVEIRPRQDVVRRALCSGLRHALSLGTRGPPCRLCVGRRPLSSRADSGVP
jgi:hypothetical protein